MLNVDSTLINVSVGLSLSSGGLSMETTQAAPAPAHSAHGLEGIVVANTKLSHVDGEHGRLIIAGHDVEQLAGRHSFEEVCTMLWSLSGDLAPDTAKALGTGRVEAFARLRGLGDALTQPLAMDSLRSALSQLPESSSAASLVGAAAVFAAAWHRVRGGLSPIAPNPAHSHARDFLAMLGLDSAPMYASALDAYMVTVADHGLNASTFTARVIASTGSDRVSAAVGAVGALKGPLHGGAPGPVLDMLDAVAEAARAEQVLHAQLERGERIMGMGHRIYRVRDPRAFVLERAVERLERELASSDGTPSNTSSRLGLARAVERIAERLLCEQKPNRVLRANVEFYTAILLEALGLPRELFSAVFACSRTLGWTAHYSEQRATGRLIRPASRYVGTWPA
jgi:citrate synthase